METDLDPHGATHLSLAASWVNTQHDGAGLEVGGGVMRDRALELIAAFPWARVCTRAPVVGS